MSERPNWDQYFLGMCFEVAKRSDDVFIKLGSIITSESHHIIGTGYNALPKGINETHVDIYDREKRRPYMIHAEENAILNCARNPDLKNMTLYVSGRPCTPCLIKTVNFGVSRIVYLDQLVSKFYIENEEQKEFRKNLIQVSGIKLIPISLSDEWISRYVKG